MKDIKKRRRYKRGHKVLIPLILYFFIFAVYNSTAQSVLPVPLDPDMRYGQLANGLTYYIKALPGSKEGVSMRLVHKVGSNDEREDEGDFAHAIEHLAFQSTKSFPLGIENDERFNSSGFGNYKVNASSGRRNTTYKFNIGEPSPEGLKLGFLWFKEIIQNLTLTKEDIESTRGEVREEYLGKVGTQLAYSIASSKMYSRIFPCEESEEGLLDHYDYFSPEKIRKFYEAWYHPKLMALIIVGNIHDPVDVEKQVRSTFSIKPSKGLSVRPQNCDSLYFEKAPQFVIVERKIDSNKLIQDKSAEGHLIFRLPEFQPRLESIDRATKTFYLKMMLDILNERLREGSEKYEMKRPLIYDLYTQDLPSAMEIVFSFKNGAGKETVKKIAKVYHQLQKYGILESEFIKAKEKLLFKLDWLKEDQPEYWLQEIDSHFIRGEVLPAQKKLNILKYVDDLKMKNLNNFIKEHLVKSPEDIGFIAPAGHEALSFKEGEVRFWFVDALDENIKPYKNTEVKTLLSNEEVKSLEAVKFIDKGIEDFGAEKIILTNGVEVVILPTSSNDPVSQHRINLHGFRIGGAKFLTEDDYWSALNASQIVSNSGVNGLTNFEVNRILRHQNILAGAVAPYIDNAEHGIYGSAKPENLETILQLVYLFFTRPNMNKLAFENWKSEKIDWYLKSSADLYAADFNEARRRDLGDKNLQNSHNRRHLPAGTLGILSLEETDYEKSFNIFRRFFGDAEGFTFLITGDFEIDEILPLVLKYLGNLPGPNLHKMPTENKNSTFPEGSTFQELSNKGNLNMPNISYGTSFIIKPEDFYDWKERMKIEVLGEVVRQKMWDLRFKKGYGLYDVSARGQMNYNLRRYEIHTYLFCQPKDFERLQEEIRQIYSDIIMGEISEEELSGAREMVEYFNFSEKAIRLGTKINGLYHHYRFNYPWTDIGRMSSFTKELNREDIVEVAKKYLEGENFHEYVIKGN
ncbi:insulinase family protein [Salinimicrobium sp. MT39]|uniref:Insulinase family protein n=1 Tax=Salinimicrobium profundisediminis TaxID=2994553 RepID=A0A9X3I1E6_9FLAO|nr:insulinase family protein [Salinimicrobium profundisediminis]MCX2838373.1 insulinase family protein [Salinimicrobium profundisediminis]